MREQSEGCVGTRVGWLRAPALLAILAAIALVLAACGGDDDAGTQTGGTTVTQPGQTQPQPTGAETEPVGTPGRDTVKTPGFPNPSTSVAHLVEVRAASHENGEDTDFDRIVLEFEKGAEEPSWRVGYVEPPIREDGSGNTVKLAGDAFLELRLTPASGADLSGDEMRITYDGPNRIEVDGEVATELVRTGDFEATLTWVLGVEERAPFAVAFLDNPPRLVVDVVDEE